MKSEPKLKLTFCLLEKSEIGEKEKISEIYPQNEIKQNL